MLWDPRSRQDLYNVQGFPQTLWARLTRNENSSLILDTLRNLTHRQKAAVFSLYCDYQAPNQSPVNMIGALLKQVVAGQADILSEIKYHFKESGKLGGQGLRLADMVNLFVKTSRSFERVFICIDAIDELLAKDRPDFIRALRHIIDGAPNIQLFSYEPAACSGGTQQASRRPGIHNPS